MQRVRESLRPSDNISHFRSPMPKVQGIRRGTLDMNHLDTCVCDECAGGCDELHPYCNDCFLCENKADADYWWEVNRADILQI